MLEVNKATCQDTQNPVHFSVSGQIYHAAGWPQKWMRGRNPFAIPFWHRQPQTDVSRGLIWGFEGEERTSFNDRILSASTALRTDQSRHAHDSTMTKLGFCQADCVIYYGSWCRKGNPGESSTSMSGSRLFFEHRGVRGTEKKSFGAP